MVRHALLYFRRRKFQLTLGFPFCPVALLPSSPNDVRQLNTFRNSFHGESLVRSCLSLDFSTRCIVVVVVVVVLFKVVPQTGVDAFFYTCRRLQN